VAGGSGEGDRRHRLLMNAVVAGAASLVAVVLSVVLDLATSYVPERPAWLHSGAVLWSIGGSLALIVAALTIIGLKYAPDATSVYAEYVETVYARLQRASTEPILVAVGLPPSRAQGFQPREDLLASLTGGATVSRHVVSGAGGVGKTQLAAHVLNEARDAGVQVTVWAGAATRANAVSVLAAAARQLGRAGMDDEPDSAAKDFVIWLSTRREPWLVVFDDVADEQVLRGLWPSGTNGRVLATTRMRHYAPSDAVGIPVSVFSPQEAVTYLTARLSGLGVAACSQMLEQADELAADLGFLPVALGQSAAYMVADGVACARYRELYAEQPASLDKLFVQDADEYERTVAATWALSIDRADQLDPAGLARPVAEIACLLDPNGAPEALWKTGAVLAYLTARTVAPNGSAVTCSQARSALRNLHRLNLLDHDLNGGPAAVTMHALAQRTTFAAMPEPVRAMAVRAAADALAELWPTAEPHSALIQALNQNAATLRTRMPAALWQPDSHLLLSLHGNSLGDAGKTADAVTYWTDMVATSTSTLGPDHTDTLTCRGNLASWRTENGDVAGAVADLEMLVTDYQRVLGPDHSTTLAARSELGRWRGRGGDTAGAVADYETLATDYQRVLGPDHSTTLAARSNVANWRGRGGDTAGAVADYETLATDYQRVLGADHPGTLAARSRLAGWRGENADIASAVADLEVLVTDYQRVLGTSHPGTLAARANVAHWRGRSGDATGAATGLEAALADYQPVLGLGHSLVVSVRNALAACREDSGDALAALAEYEATLADCLRVLGPDHPTTLAARTHLARWRARSGDAAGAATAYEALATDWWRVLGPDHPTTLAARSNAANWRWGREGDAVGAMAHYEALATDCRRVLGPDHPTTLAARSDVAHWRGRRGDLTGAVIGLEAALDDQLRVLGADHLDTLTTRTALAEWRVRSGDPIVAVTDCEAVLLDCLRVLGPDHPLVLTARTVVAASRDRSGNAAGAVTAYEAALVDCLRVLGPDHSQVLTARTNLAGCRASSGDVIGAVTDYEGALADSLRILGPDHPETFHIYWRLASWRAGLEPWRRPRTGLYWRVRMFVGVRFWFCRRSRRNP
jgi:NB-ARC domain-containing protein/tetratricopeptide repeat protein